MPTAPIFAANGGGNAGPAKSLWLDGTNVLKQPGAPGNLFGVPLDTIELVENGPPGVSSLKFTISDPLKAITLARGQEVHYHNHVTDRPYFRGWVQTWTSRPFGLGRTIVVRAIGVEAVLDWMIVPSLTIPNGTETRAAVQSVIANATGIGVALRAFAGSTASSQATPLGDIDPGVGTAVLGADVVLAGETVREAIRKVVEASIGSSFFFGAATLPALFTVDVWNGVRLWAAGASPSDYDPLTVTDTVAGALVAASLEHAVDNSGIAHAVYVKGGNAAGSGVVGDGSGLVGPVAKLDDPTILTSAARDAAGLAYLGARSTAVRGSFDLEDHATATNVHPGSALTLTDDQTGATGSYAISSIGRTFTGLRETWHVAYGRLPPSLPRALRRLTRQILG